MSSKSKAAVTLKSSIIHDVLNSAGVSAQIISAQNSVSGKKKTKQFVLLVTGSLLASLFSQFQSAVNDANNASVPTSLAGDPAPEENHLN